VRKQVLTWLGVLVLGSGTVAFAQQPPKIQNTTIQATSAADGKQVFTTYCATCHGKTGKGDGPAAAALKKAPADLTKISARNGGTFPEAKISRFIDGSDEVAAHGNRDMPVWGALFMSLNSDQSQAKLRVHNLAEYLKSLQQ
jgi:mono/diheme cytochrome c family protein